MPLIANRDGTPGLREPTPPQAGNRYREFQAKYFDDPSGFVRDCIIFPKGEAPAPYQYEILDEFQTSRRISVRGPHGLGKTAVMAWLIHWFSLTRDGLDWKLPTTASAWQQLTKFLWPEVHKWVPRLRWDVIGRPPYKQKAEILDLSIKLGTGSAFAIASDKPSSIEGAHGDHMLYLFDESKAIPDAIFDSAEGAFSTKTNIWAVAFSTPGDKSGRFYRIQTKQPGYQDWWVRHVTMQECIAAGRMSQEWADRRKEQWGEDSAMYIGRVLGNFADAKEANGVIPRPWIQLARARWRVLTAERYKLPPIEGYGVDIGESPDRTVLAPRVGNLIGDLEVLPATLNLMQIVTAIQDRCQMRKRYAIIDVVGLGAGVFSRCRELQLRAERYDARQRTDKTDTTGEIRFTNMRAYAYWNLRDMLNPTNGKNVALPDDQELEDELVAHTWKQGAGGAVGIVEKDLVKKIIGRSPDRADAVVMAMLPRPSDPIRQPGRPVAAPMG